MLARTEQALYEQELAEEDGGEPMDDDMDGVDIDHDPQHVTSKWAGTEAGSWMYYS